MSKIYLNRGKSYVSLENHGEAVNDFNRALNADPENFDAKLVLANFLFILSRYNESI